ncbi:NAD-dependent epimerase/dehydratase family protein [Sphaerisporangium aureirubrum]|uniref:NAD-dependent epimerase/dehydratase family protein n=1 Tax=Sphaerisporangium aureirubrum TaxID=1544736 RepID=A0ABW1NBP9_9ACTN
MTRLLILGGTSFLGYTLASEALTQGWDVTTFNRGRTGHDVTGVKVIRGDRYISNDITRLAKSGLWDAVADMSGYVPRNVLDVARTLRPATGRYLFMSTVSVYADWPIKPLTEASKLLECPPDADDSYGEDIEDGPTKYGYQKSGCEAAVQLTFGADYSTVLRPGVVLGPRENVGRLPWWLRRVSRGGHILSPGTPERSIQPVDVRDVALFALDCVTDNTSGAFNVTAPIGAATFGGLLDDCASTTGSDPQFVWVPDDVLIRAGVRQWSELPLWRSYPGVWQVNSGLAYARGLTCRPLSETVRDTWEWLLASPAPKDNERSGEIGLNPTREQDLLRSLTM